MMAGTTTCGSRLPTCPMHIAVTSAGPVKRRIFGAGGGDRASSLVSTARSPNPQCASGTPESSFASPVGTVLGSVPHRSGLAGVQSAPRAAEHSVHAAVNAAFLIGSFGPCNTVEGFRMPSDALADHIDLASLEPLFRPRSIAIIGASSDPAKIGGMPLQFLKSNGYAGAVYPVNPSAPTIQGLTAFASIRDIGQPIDLAVIAVPAAAVIPALEACAAVGVRAVIIFTAGFAETDGDGGRQQEKIAEIAARHRMRIMGPNCIGLVNFANGLYASFHPAFADAGRAGGSIGAITQSGAFGGLLHRMGRDRDIAFSYCITTGNEVDVDVADGIAFLAEDSGTKV